MGYLGQFKSITLTTSIILIACLGVITLANTSLLPQKPKAKKADEFGFINRGDLEARLDNLAVQLQNEPTATTYIKFHSGRRLPPEEIEKTATYARNYLVKSRGIDPGRITTLDAGPDRNSTVQFWIVPQGAEPPV